MVVLEGMTPGEYKRMGQGVRVRYGVHETVYGSMLIALTARGICKLVFFSGDDRAARAEGLAGLPRCELVRDDRATRVALRDAGLLARSVRRSGSGRRAPLRLCVQGTAFQIKVWQALLSVPEGSLVSYRQLARAVGAPGAARAVGNAVGSNPIAVLIPCHRVIRESGVLHAYRWGEERKKVVLGRELGRHGFDLGSA